MFSSIIENFSYLQKDFTGISFSLEGSSVFLLYIFVVLLLFVLYFFFGRRVRELFLRNVSVNEAGFFLDIALGFIGVNTVLAFLGLFSLFYFQIIIIYVLSVSVFAFLPIQKTKIVFASWFKEIKNVLHLVKSKRWISLAVLCFVFIGFLRLSLPEIGEDAIGYHTDLPKIYLETHTTLHKALEAQQTTLIPQLGEMSYVLVETIGLRDATRFIHFGFYLLTVSLLFVMVERKKKMLLAPLLFVTAPIVIRITSMANVDFPMVFLWLLALYFLIESQKQKELFVVLSAIMFGGAIATKLWTVVYFPVLFSFILVSFGGKLKKRVYLCLLYLVCSLLIPLVWFVRSFVVSGNPIFPFFSQMFEKSQGTQIHTVSHYIGFNLLNLSLPNLIVYSPLFFLGLFLLLFLPKSEKKIVFRDAYFQLFVFTFFIHTFVTIYLGRHLLALYSIGIFPAAYSLGYFAKKFRVVSYSIFVLTIVLYTYYTVTTALILPYGFGWAKKASYLTRVLGRDNSSYYDFDGKFNKFISSKDYVLIDGIYGFYYVPFRYIDSVQYFFYKKSSISAMRKAGITKIFVKGGQISWFCEQYNILDCQIKSFRLLATFPNDQKKYNLYQLLPN